MNKLKNLLIISIGILFISCSPKTLYMPDQKPKIIFPIYNTNNIEYKRHIEIEVYPMLDDNNTTVYILKEEDYKKWKTHSIEAVKDYNSLLDSITYFNAKVKEKEIEYNK